MFRGLPPILILSATLHDRNICVDEVTLFKIKFSSVVCIIRIQTHTRGIIFSVELLIYLVYGVLLLYYIPNHVIIL